MRNHTFRQKKKKKRLSSVATKAAGTCGDLGHQAVENRAAGLSLGAGYPLSPENVTGLRPSPI